MNGNSNVPEKIWQHKKKQYYRACDTYRLLYQQVVIQHKKEEYNMKLYAFADEASFAIDEQILAMQRNGLNGLEIRFVDGTMVSDISMEKAKEVRGKLDAAGLSVWSAGSPIGKINIVEDDFTAHMDKFRHTLEIAKILGAENIRLFSFYMPQNESCSQYRDEVIRRLKMMVEIAAGTGIDLCHENEKGIYGDIAVRCLELHQAIPELKGVFDPANFVQCGQDTIQAWEMLHPHIKYLHIKDALPSGKVVPAGAGIGNVPTILQRFIQKGGNAVTIEPHLTVFNGFEALEQGGNASEVDNFVYPSNDVAFDVACNALKSFL